MFFAYTLVSGEGHRFGVSAFTLKRIKNIKKTPIWIVTNQMKRPSKSTAMTFQLIENLGLLQGVLAFHDFWFQMVIMKCEDHEF